MPELPEVEVTRRGLLKRIAGKVCDGVTVRETRFRKPVPENLDDLISGQRLLDIERRGKYLIWLFERAVLVSHLGMSGVLRVYVNGEQAVQKHDHIDLIFGDLVVRYHDPRRFGFMIYCPDRDTAYQMPELQKLGVEPLTDEFTADRLYNDLRGVASAIKQALLSGKYVVGVGNIYCSESLFAAGIRPTTPANKISRKRIEKLVDTIKAVLAASIELGGSTLKDFVSAEGKEGYFTLNNNVYDREGKPCRQCGAEIKKIIQDGRATYYCPHCQK